MSVNNPRILVADDDPTSLMILNKLLSPLYQVETASNGLDALTAIRQQPPDLILLDVMMPIATGFEVCRQIKEDSELAHIPVIFITCLNQLDQEIQGLELGAVDYIYKPFNIELVKLRIRNQMELIQQRSKLKQTLALIKRLEGIIPICMYCKKIRNDDDYWQQVEEYITERSDVWFSHGICPSCLEKKYPESNDDAILSGALDAPAL
jgi:CheY-like chemotaxis protein